MMKQTAINATLFNLKSLIVDKLYRFADSFFDDSREKTDFVDIKCVHYFVRNSGIAYLALKKKSSKLIPILSEVFEIFSGYADFWEKTIRTIPNRLLLKTAKTVNDISNARIYQKTEPIKEELFPTNHSVPYRVLIALSLAANLIRDKMNASGFTAREQQFHPKTGYTNWCYQVRNISIRSSPG